MTQDTYLGDILVFYMNQALLALDRHKSNLLYSILNQLYSTSVCT